jgi:hypothetical protein
MFGRFFSQTDLVTPTVPIPPTSLYFHSQKKTHFIQYFFHKTVRFVPVYQSTENDSPQNPHLGM